MRVLPGLPARYTRPALHSEELTSTEPGGEPEDATLVGGALLRDEGEADFGSGSRLGRYVVLSKMGAGGMGVVYAAYDPDLDRRVAVKLMHQQHGDQASEREVERASRRLLAEAKAMAQLSHPNVIAVHDVGTIDDRVFIAMEFVEGVPLGEWIQGEHDRESVLAVFTKAGRGLEAAHDAGLVHRDFKPENVLCGDDGRVRVLDFGLARRFDASADLRARHTGTREAGTPAYMAPEQHTGGELDHRADQFAFAVALYQGLYGELPFAGKSRMELAIAVTDGRVRPAPKGVEVPNWVRAALLRALSPIPQKRFSNMGALLQALGHDPYRRLRKIAQWAVVSLLTLAFILALVQAVTAAADGAGNEGDTAGSGFASMSAAVEDARALLALASAPEAELEQALDWLGQAELIAERAGADDLRVDIAIELARVQLRSGAIEHAERALARAEAIVARQGEDPLRDPRCVATRHLIELGD